MSNGTIVLDVSRLAAVDRANSHCALHKKDTDVNGTMNLLWKNMNNSQYNFLFSLEAVSSS